MRRLSDRTGASARATVTGSASPLLTPLRARSAGRLTPEQRDSLRRQIDTRVRERLSELSGRGASPGGYVPRLPR